MENEYSAFVFYGSWKVYLDQVYKRNPEYAKNILWEIIQFGTTNEYQTDDESIVALIEGLIKENLLASQKRYCASIINGNKGGNKKIDIDMEQVHLLQSKGQTLKQIGAYFGVSYKTIERRLKEERQTDIKTDSSDRQTGQDRTFNNNINNNNTIKDTISCICTNGTGHSTAPEFIDLFKELENDYRRNNINL